MRHYHYNSKNSPKKKEKREKNDIEIYVKNFLILLSSLLLLEN